MTLLAIFKSEIEAMLGGFQYPEGFWPDSDTAIVAQGFDYVMDAMFQYPEGFWPDSDGHIDLPPGGYSLQVSSFQYPEGFWPDSDLALPVGVVALVVIMLLPGLFQYPEGFWPDSDKRPRDRLGVSDWQNTVSVPRRVLAR